MGSNTLLYILLLVVLVGVAVAAGITSYRGRDLAAAHDALRLDLKGLSVEAMNYHERPRFLGGGGKSFEGFNSVKRKKVGRHFDNLPAPSGNELWVSENGIYTVLVAARDSVVVEGLGDQIGLDDTNPIRVRAVIKVRSVRTEVLN